MLDHGGLGGGQDFAAMPRVVQSKARFKDPYGAHAE